jgi:predicted Zn-dependent protease
MKFSVTFPSGWQHANTKEAVMAASPDQDAAIQITMAKGSDPQQALQAFLSQQGVRSTGTGATRAGAPSAQFSATTEQGEVSGMVTMIGHGGKVLQFLSLTSPSKFPSYAGAFAQVPASFQNVTDPAVLNVQPGRLAVERVPRAMTLGELYQERKPSVSVATIALINQMQPGTPLKAGQMIKLVHGGTGVDRNAPVSLK